MEDRRRKLHTNTYMHSWRPFPVDLGCFVDPRSSRTVGRRDTDHLGSALRKAVVSSSPVADPIAAVAKLEQRLVAASGEDAFEVALAVLAAKLVAEMDQEPFAPKKHLALARKRYPALALEPVRLEAKLLARVLEPLAPLSITGSDRAVLDAALERLVARGSKGALGQYFTPRNVIELVVSALAPTKKDTVIDPACGSGGFLFAAAARGARCNGIDLGAKSFRVAQLLALATPNVDVHRGDGLREGKPASIVLMNPPFAGIVADRALLARFEAPRTKASREQLFVERAVQLMARGGRAAVVVPQGLLANATSSGLRGWLHDACAVRAVVGLHAQAFFPYTTVKTAIVFLERTKKKEPALFVTSASPSDYVPIAATLHAFFSGKKVTRGSIVEETELRAHDRLDAEYWESGVRDLHGHLEKKSTRTIGDFVSTKIARFKKRPGRIAYVDISSVDGSTAIPTALDGDRAPSRAVHLAEKGDVLVSTVRPDRNVVALLDRASVASSGFCVLRPERIEPELLYAYCKTETFRRLLARRATASMYPVATYEDVRAIPFVLPPAKEKKAIVARIARGIALVEEGKREIATGIAAMEAALKSR